MTLVEVLKMMSPGMIASYGQEDEPDYVEIFMKSDSAIRFSDQLMMIDAKCLNSDKWNIKED